MLCSINRCAVRPVILAIHEGTTDGASSDAHSLSFLPTTHNDPRQASDLYLAKRYEESLQAFSQALLLAPDAWHERPKLHCNRAAALIMLHRYEEAVKDCEQAVARDPALLKAYTRCGRAYLHMGVLDRALQCFEEVRSRALAAMRAKFGGPLPPPPTSRAQAGELVGWVVGWRPMHALLSAYAYT